MNIYWKLKTKKGQSFLVDDVDLVRVMDFGWCLDSNGYVVSNSSLIKLHRFITGAPEGMLVDHKNGVKTDARRCNLRLVNAVTNGLNHRTRRGKMRGTYAYKTQRGNRYMARLRQTKIGNFDTKIEAALAYDRALYAEAGADSHINFPCAFIGDMLGHMKET